MTTVSALMPIWTTMRSPGRSPRAERPAAMTSDRSSRSAQVNRAPPTTRATFDPATRPLPEGVTDGGGDPSAGGEAAVG